MASKKRSNGLRPCEEILVAVSKAIGDYEGSVRKVCNEEHFEVVTPFGPVRVADGRVSLSGIPLLIGEDIAFSTWNALREAYFEHIVASAAARRGASDGTVVVP